MGEQEFTKQVVSKRLKTKQNNLPCKNKHSCTMDERGRLLLNMILKTYYADQHEAPDVIELRNIYLVHKFNDKLEEVCWVQIPAADYNLC